MSTKVDNTRSGHGGGALSPVVRRSGCSTVAPSNALVNLPEVGGTARVLCYHGRFQEAVALFDRRWQQLRRSCALRIQLVRTGALQWRARALAGAYRQARQQRYRTRARRDARRLIHRRFPGAKRTAFVVLASLSVTDNVPVGAQHWLQRAIGVFAQEGMRCDLAVAQVALAGLVRGSLSDELERSVRQ